MERSLLLLLSLSLFLLEVLDLLSRTLPALLKKKGLEVFSTGAGAVSSVFSMALVGNFMGLNTPGG